MFLTVPKLQTLSHILGLSDDLPHPEVVLRSISHLIAWQRHFFPPDCLGGFRSLSKEPKLKPDMGFLHPRTTVGSLLPASLASTSLPLQSPSQKPPLPALPLPRCWICCASPSSCHRGLCGDYLHYTNPCPYYRVSFCECVLNYMKIST